MGNMGEKGNYEEGNSMYMETELALGNDSACRLCISSCRLKL